MAMISAATLLAAATAGAQEGDIALSPDGGAFSGSRPACCVHDWFAKLGVGYRNTEYKVGNADAIKKGGALASVGVGYAHLLNNGLVLGGGVEFEFPFSSEKEEGGAKYKLKPFVPSVGVFVGYNCPQIKGVIALGVDGVYTNTEVTLAATGAKTDFKAFSPKIKLSYMGKFHKVFGAYVEVGYTLGLKKKVDNTELKTGGLAVSVGGIFDL
ncbi:MAG: DUF481 domain-containing protein [Holosporales bacterium]|nr:DUF481 domain-containing protein [Holosporales bacterium]